MAELTSIEEIMWLFKVISVANVVFAWANKSMQDGTIDPVEAGELVHQICAVLGVKAKIDIPTPGKE